MLKFNIVKNSPVARFFYKGSHTHPVRRTVLVIESNKDIIRGYELREGSIVRNAKDAPIKSYSRKNIAKGESLRKDNPMRKTSPKKSTLVRQELLDLVVSGI